MDYFNQMDTDSAALIVHLQLEDLLEVHDSQIGKGKRRIGDLSDIEVALTAYRDELERVAVAATDRQMFISMSRACLMDGNVLTASLSEEQVAIADHEAACQLGGVPVEHPVDPWIITSDQMDDEILAKYEALYIAAPGSIEASRFDMTLSFDSTATEQHDTTAMRSSAKTGRAPRECVACRDTFEFQNVIRVPCGDEYCRECLQGLFRMSLTDDSLFPPRCCRQHIATGGVRLFLPSELIRAYEAKKMEFDTVDKTYCSNPTCSAFIPVENIFDEEASCFGCSSMTCSLCKGPLHIGDCPADTGLQEVLRTADDNGWQRCYSCRRVVELEHGCNHMT